jgi:hypothetical protein
MAEHSQVWTDWRTRLEGAARALGQMVYGASIYEMVRDLNKERGLRERLFVLAVFGDVLGVPILPPYYALRLLPYVVPKVEGWRYSMLRERDLTDLCDQEIT